MRERTLFILASAIFVVGVVGCKVEPEIYSGMVLTAKRETIGMWNPWTDGRFAPKEDSILLYSGEKITVDANKDGICVEGRWVRGYYEDMYLGKSKSFRWFEWRDFEIPELEGG